MPNTLNHTTCLKILTRRAASHNAKNNHTRLMGNPL